MSEIGTKEAARILCVTQETIRRYCKEGTIHNATQDGDGSPWHIPKESVDILRKQGVPYRKNKTKNI